MNVQYNVASQHRQVNLKVYFLSRTSKQNQLESSMLPTVIYFKCKPQYLTFRINPTNIYSYHNDELPTPELSL